MTSHATILSLAPAEFRPEGPRFTSLVSSSETVGTLMTHCPRRPVQILVNLKNPTQTIQTGCDAYICEWCGPRKAKKFAQACAWELRQHDRSRFVTLTMAKEDWQARRAEMKETVRELRSAGYSFEWAWTTEVGSKTGMIHIHASQWGDYMTQRDISNQWGRRVDIREIKKSQETVTNYMAKGVGQVMAYMAKGANEDYTHWLELNGGRPIHTTRGFFRGQGVRGAWASLQAENKTEDSPIWSVLDPHLARIWYDLRNSHRKDWKEEWAATFTAWESLHEKARRSALNLGDIGSV